MSDLQELFYDEIVTRFNEQTTQGLLFNGGYDFVMYRNIPYVINQDNLEQFNFERNEVIPIAQVFSNETPTAIPNVDRSDYTAQFELMFRLEKLTEVKTSINEFVSYMKANKDFQLDGFNIGVRLTRGEKQATWMADGGNLYGRYRITIFYTAINGGYIFKSSDKWEIKLASELDTSYVQMKEIQDNMANSGNANPDNETTSIKHYNTSTSWTNKFQIFYDGSTTTENIYTWIKNKFNETFKLNTEFTIKETFNGNTETWNVIITGGGRTKTPNGVAILEFDVREV